MKLRKIFAGAVLCGALLGPSVTGLAHTMPASELRLGPLGVSSTLDQVEALFGAPPQREVYDTAWLHITAYIYPGLTVVTRQALESEEPAGSVSVAAVYVSSGTLATRSGFVTTPAGFAVGMPYARVTEKYGKVEPVRFTDELDIYPYTPEELPGRELAFKVDRAGIIREIAIRKEA